MTELEMLTDLLEMRIKLENMQKKCSIPENFGLDRYFATARVKIVAIESRIRDYYK